MSTLSKWRDEHTTKILKLYQDRPCLWNNQSEDYKDNLKKTKAYLEMIEDLAIEGLSIDMLKAKIKALRTNYKKEYNKIMRSEKSGAGIDDLYKPKLFWFYQADSFLRSVTIPRKSLSTKVSKETCRIVIKFLLIMLISIIHYYL